MKKILFLLLVFTGLATASLHAQPGFGVQIPINGGWRFCLDSLGDHSSPQADDSAWRTVDVPHDWSVEGVASPSLASCTGYLPGGVGWYRRTVAFPAAERNRKQFLYFNGVYCNSTVWFNGHRLGTRPNGYVSFMYDVTPYVKIGRPNSIVVKVDHSQSADSRWYTGSGIWRDVLLVSCGKLHIDQWGVFATTSEVSERSAEIAVATTLCNETEAGETLRVEHKLYTLDGAAPLATATGQTDVPAAGKGENRLTLRVENPKLWSVAAPNLYRIETSVWQGTRRIDATTTVTGIRTVRFDPDKGLFLNGESIKMKGVCLHHDAGSLGAAVPREVWERRLTSLRELGCNAIRMSHNLQDRVLYDLCDRMGLLVMDEVFDEWEFPKRKWIEGWNVGKNPGLQGYAEYFDDWAERDLRDAVMRDRNHPSIILWSVGNEVDYPNDPYSHPILDKEGINQKSVPGYKPDKPAAERYGKIALRLVKVVKQVDTTRAVTGALAGVVMSNQTDYPAALDAVGYNYTESRYALDHRLYPDRVIYGSENTHEYPLWEAVRDNAFISGQFLWTGIDYLGEAGPWPSRGFVCGLLDLGGFVTPRGDYRRSLWSDEPTVCLGTAQSPKKARMFDLPPVWNYDAAKGLVRVAVMTNCKEAMLLLNGKPVETEPLRDALSNALCWDIPYRPGELKAVGLVDGKPAAEYIVRTHGPAASLVVAADRTTLLRKGVVAHVVLQIVDKDGLRVMDARNDVQCTVTGPGRLLALENADPKYMDSQRGGTTKAYRGRVLAYVASTSTDGVVEVKFTSPGLPEASVELQIVRYEE